MKRVQILIPEGLLAEIDRVVGRGSRSEFIREAVGARLCGSEPKPASKPSPKPIPKRKVVDTPVRKLRSLLTGEWQAVERVADRAGLQRAVAERFLGMMAGVEMERGRVRLE